MEQLIFGIMQEEQAREEAMKVDLAKETVDVLVTLMACAMVVVVRGAKEEGDEG
jgi:hypothetical protein